MKRLVLVAVLLLVAGASQAQLHKGEDFGGHGPWAEHADRFGGEHFEQIAAYLELDEQQIQEWTSLHEEFAASASVQREAIGSKAEELESLVEEGSDAEAIGRLVLEMAAERKALHERHDELEERLKTVLTPDQVDRFEALEALRPRSREGRMGRGHRALRHHRAPDQSE